MNLQQTPGHQACWKERLSPARCRLSYAHLQPSLSSSSQLILGSLLPQGETPCSASVNRFPRCLASRRMAGANLISRYGSYRPDCHTPASHTPEEYWWFLCSHPRHRHTLTKCAPPPQSYRFPPQNSLVSAAQESDTG